MKLEKTTTGLIIHQPSDDIKRKCLQYFSLVNPVREYFIYSGNDSDKKPIFGKEKDVIYITSGFLRIEDPVIRALPKPSIITPPTPKHVEIEMSRSPRSDLQRDCIDKMINSNESKLTIELKPGTGKTFIALYSISKLCLKPLIIAPTTLLKNQWVDNFVESGIDRSDIATHIYDAPNKTFCVVTISAIENELRKDWEGLMRVINKASFGIKVVDESHLHLKGLLKLDSICNIKHNWYLSATLGRSDVLEDKILNRALLDADRFVGNGKYEEYQHEFVNVYFQDVYYNPSNKLCQEYFRYGSKGLIRSTYYNMLMNYHDGVPFINNLILLMKRVRSIITYNGKILLLVPLISIIERLIEEMKKDPYFDKYTYSGVDGSMSLPNRQQAMECDFILSTSMSMGTGVDVSNLASVINFDQMQSPIITEQICGRLRDRGKETWYVDVCDHVRQARMLENWGNKRRIIIPYFPGVKPDLKVLPKITC
jgi:hypothetical protein